MNAMVDFAKAFEAGELEPYIKSQPIPEQDDDNVRIAVGKNFADVVAEDKDVFVEFYAPWCGHCKKLAPTWSELADKFADDDNVVIAKMDATANDIPPEFPVRGYPRLVSKREAGEAGGVGERARQTDRERHRDRDSHRQRQTDRQM